MNRKSRVRNRTFQPSNSQGIIYGRLLAASGTPSREMAEPRGVPGQQVAVLDPLSGNIVAKATTGSDGSFRLIVPGGDYLLVNGGTRQYLRVGPGEEIRLNLALPVL
jgi:hypothetical protein